MRSESPPLDSGRSRSGTPRNTVRPSPNARYWNTVLVRTPDEDPASDPRARTFSRRGCAGESPCNIEAVSGSSTHPISPSSRSSPIPEEQIDPPPNPGLMASDLSRAVLCLPLRGSAFGPALVTVGAAFGPALVAVGAAFGPPLVRSAVAAGGGERRRGVRGRGGATTNENLCRREPRRRASRHRRRATRTSSSRLDGRTTRDIVESTRLGNRPARPLRSV